MSKRHFGRSSSPGSPQDSGSKKRKLSQPFDQGSSSASHSWKEVQEVNDSLDQPYKQSGIPTLQVLFFHGLPFEDFSNVHLTTWDNGDGFIWPQAWLVEEFRGAHIFFVKYSEGMKNRCFNMNNIGENLISDLIYGDIGQVPGCPVVLVGHCIGGLVIKELCLKAHEQLRSCNSSMSVEAKKLEAFLDSVKGIFYVSTPHHGIPEISKATHVLQQSLLFKYFEMLSTDTAVLNSNFDHLCRLYPKWKIRGIGESRTMNEGIFKNALVVPEASARDGTFNMVVEVDHFSICKPKKKTSGAYYHLTRFLHNIVEEAIKLQEDNCPQNLQHLPKGIVGIEIALEEIKTKLENATRLGLIGMGGLGKTTLAKAVFNELGCKFEYSCFVPDVKLIIGERVEMLKEEVWKHMHWNGKKVVAEMDWSKLRGKRLLLVLDDMSNDRDVRLFSEIAQGPSTESRFIATSRERDVFNLFDDVYDVQVLDRNNAQQLFKSYAFQDRETPPTELETLVEQIVEKCDGLPLTLEVLGQWLKRTRDEEDWKQTLDALDKAEFGTSVNEKLWGKLRPSIDKLGENEKQMFLDATTFFSVGWTLREARAAWKVAYGGSEKLLWWELVDRSLVYRVEDDEDIKVHEQLRSLGRRIASDNGMWRDISEAQDLLQVTNKLDKKDIHALRLVRCRRNETPMDREGLHALQLIALQENLEPNVLVDGKIHIASLALQNLNKLCYLEVDNFDNSIVIDGAQRFPNSLLVFKCAGFKTLDVAHQQRLAVLKISLVEYVPNSIGQLSALRIFSLSNTELESIPDEIGHLSQLEVLEFDWCINVRTLPETFGQLSKLKSMKVSCCLSLCTLPESFGNLTALKHLVFRGLPELKTLPESFGNLSALEHLGFYSCELETLSESFGNLCALEHLGFNQCPLSTLPESFGNISALKHLEFDSCRLETLPESFGNLTSLGHLEFNYCQSITLPESFGNLSALEHLKFIGGGLEILPKSFGKLSALNYLQIDSCDRLESLPESFGHLSALAVLKFSSCESLKSLPKTFGHLSALSRLDFIQCDKLQSLPESFGKLPVLSHLRLDGCYDLQSLPESFGQSAKLQYRETDLIDLEVLPESVAELLTLRSLSVCGCLSMNSIPEHIKNLPSLHILELGELPHVKELPPWLGETGLNSLAVSRKIFRIQDRHFSLTRDETTMDTFDLVIRVHSRAMRKVDTSDYKGALAELEVCNIGVPVLDGFLLQEKGITKRLMGDLDGALQDLSGALECFSKVDDGDNYSYDCWKYRGYVNFLMGDREAAENDGKMALKLPLQYRRIMLPGIRSRISRSLGDKVLVEYMDFRLGERRAMQEHWKLMSSSHSEVLQKVERSDFQGALASFDVINVRLLCRYSRAFFLQERGILKRLTGDLDGALEDLSGALQCFSKVDDGDNYSYDCWKHRGYVNFLMGDREAAENDGKMALKLQLQYRRIMLPGIRSGISQSLGDKLLVEYMDFRLGGRRAMQEHKKLMSSSHSQVLQKVKASDFQGALASFDVIDARLLCRDRAYFLQERGVLKRLAGNLDGALEDLTEALERAGDDYECFKHRGYVKYLLGDLDGARMDAKKCLTLGYHLQRKEHLAAAPVVFMEFDLK